MGIRRTRVQLEAEISGYTTQVRKAKGDTKDLRQEAERFDRGRYNAKLDVDTKDAHQELSALERRMLSYAQEDPTARAKLNTDEARMRLAKLQEDMVAFAAQTASADVDVNDSEAQRKFKSIEARLLALGRASAHPDIDIDGIAAAEAQLALLEAQLRKIDNNSPNPHVRVTGMAEIQKDASLLLDTVALLGPTAVVAGTAASGAMVALAGSMAMGAGAAGVLATSFIGVGDALTALNEVHKHAAENTQEMARTEVMANRQIADARRGVERAEMMADRNIADARRSLARTQQQAAQDVADAERNLEQVRADAVLQERQAARAVVAAQRNVTRARQDAADAARSAAQQIEDAEEGVADAERAVADAHENVTDALADLHDARQQAIRDLQDLREQNSDNALTIRGAQLGVARAKQNLIETLRDEDSTWLDIAEARLAVREAEDAYSDAKREGKRDREDLNKAEKDGIAGSDAVVSAQEALQDAYDGVREAQNRLIDSREALTDAQRNAARVERDNAQSIKDALMALNDAEANQVQTRRENAQAIIDAKRDLVRAERSGNQDIADARRNLARAIADGDMSVADANRVLKRALQDSRYELGKNNTQLENLRMAMQNLSPEAREFVRFLDGLRPKLRHLRDIAQANIFPGLQEGIEDVLNLMPEAEGIVESYSEAWGDLAREAGDALDSPFWHQYFDFLDQKAEGSTKRMVRALGNFVEGLAAIQQAFFPLQKDVENGILGWARSFNRWAKSLDDSERFEDFLAYIDRVGPRLIELVGSIVDALLEIGEAAAPVGEKLIPVLKAIAEFAAAIADSPLGTPLVAMATGLAAVNRGIRVYEAGASNRAVIRTHNLASRFRDAESRAGAFRDSLRGLAGVGGMGLLLHATTQTNGKIRTFENITGGALSGFAVGGPWGALVGAGAGALLSLSDATSGASDAQRELVRTQRREKEASDNVTQSINQQTGAITHQTKVAVARAIIENRELSFVLSEIGVSTHTAMLAALGNEKAMKKVTEAAKAWNKQSDGNKISVKALMGDVWGLTKAQRKESELIRESNAAAKNWDRTLDGLAKQVGVTEGRTDDFRKAIRDLEQANYDQTGSAKLSDKQLERVAEQMGLNKKETDELIKKYKEVPPKIDTEVNWKDDKARKQSRKFVQDTNKLLKNLGKGTALGITLGLQGPNTTQGLADQQQGDFLQGHSAGGPIGGRGTGTSDQVPFMGSRGEWVIRQQVSQTEGSANMSMLNSGQGTIVPRYAVGGELKKTYPVPIPVRMDYSDARQDIKALMRAATSGYARIGAAITWARKQVGDPYGWGDVGPNSWDCSGFMSGITNFLRGDPLHVRLGSTSSFPWPGFARGADPKGFTIGSTPNYGGSGTGHMAGSLAGVHVESRGGEGVVVGPRARGYNDPFFSEIYHLTGLKQKRLRGGGGDTGALSGPERWIINREAGSIFNVNANNPSSSAFGLGQLLEANRIKYARQLGYNWGIERGDVGSTNRDRQIDMFRAYVRDRYGNAENAKNFWQNHGWYDKGGAFPTGTFGSNTSGATEEVLTNTERKAFLALGKFAHMSMMQFRGVGNARAAGASVGGELTGTIRIVNWETGRAIMRLEATNIVNQQAALQSNVARMG